MTHPPSIFFSRQAAKDRHLLAQAGLERRAKVLLDVLAADPFQTPPPYEKLVGDLLGFSSRRIDRQHRLVYAAYPEEQVVKVLRMWTHYE